MGWPREDDGGEHNGASCLLLSSHVIAHQLVLIAQVEPAADDDRLSPAWIATDVIGLEVALQAVGARCRFDEGDFAALVAEYQVAIGIRDGGRIAAGPAFLPTPYSLAG